MCCVTRAGYWLSLVLHYLTHCAICQWGVGTCSSQGMLPATHSTMYVYVGSRELGEKRGHPWAPQQSSCQIMAHLPGQLSPDPVPSSLTWFTLDFNIQEAGGGPDLERAPPSVHS